MRPTLHVLGLPHTQSTHEYLHCAYTQKLVKFGKMMREQGWRCILYHGDATEADYDEHVALFTEEERTETYGAWNPDDLFAGVTWDPEDASWQRFNERAIKEIRKRSRRQDFLCMSMGWSQLPVAEALKDKLLPIEYGVGYEGITRWHRVFESYAWMHHVYGLRKIKDGGAYDAVIPNYFDPADFKGRGPRGDDLLFIGRVVARKGPHIAAAIAERVGRKLIIAGAGAVQEDGAVVAPEIRIEGDHVRYVGAVDRAHRAKLLSQAAAVIVPTVYIEPFGGVAAEAMMAGTPVVASDWGAFPEYVLPGMSGERFHTLQEGADAVERAMQLSPRSIRRYAHSRFSLDAVGQQYTRHLQRLEGLWGVGWHA